MTLLAPVDAMRSAVLRAASRATPTVGRRLFADRDARVVLYGVLATATALALAVLTPLWLLALGPIVLGVPHLMADARYLVVRPGLHRRVPFLVAVLAPLVLVWLWPTLAAGLVGVLGAIVVARGALVKKALLALVWAALFAGALAFGRTGDVLFAHLHNFVAIGLWWAWTGKRRPMHGLVLLAFGLGLAFCFFGPALDIVWKMHAFSAPGSGLDLGREVRSLSPVADPTLGVRFVLAFAFAQSVHYAVWLRVLPEDDRARPGMRSFASSWNPLLADMGTVPVALAGAVLVGLLAWALSDPAAARDGYLRLAISHGHLELAVIALLLVEGVRPRDAATT
jgi:hypothetical protein